MTCNRIVMCYSYLGVAKADIALHCAINTVSIRCTKYHINITNTDCQMVRSTGYVSRTSTHDNENDNDHDHNNAP
jgi:hypothetical protein